MTVTLRDGQCTGVSLHVVRPVASLCPNESRLKYLRELLCNQGPTEIVSLPLVAAMGLKKCQLFWCFHSLSDHPVLETFTPADNRANDDSIVCAYNDIVHARLVHL